MFKILLLIFSFLAFVNSYTQQTQNIEEEYYIVKGLAYVKEYDIYTKLQTEILRIPREGLKFKIVGFQNNSLNPSEDLIIIKFFGITYDPFYRYSGVDSVNNTSIYLTKEDNASYFWMKRAEFENHIKDEIICFHKATIFDSFTKGTSLSYGIFFSFPLKYRSAKNGVNDKITQSINFETYLGVKFRISNTEPLYIMPVATIGISNFFIDNDVNYSENPIGDGVILGVTGSVGIMLKYSDFQLGANVGIDKASGEIGKNWLYNDELWYGISIGYTFLGN